MHAGSEEGLAREVDHHVRRDGRVGAHLLGNDLVHDAHLGAQHLADLGRHVGEDRQREADDRLFVVTNEVEQLPRGRQRSLRRCGGLVIYSVWWGSWCSIELG